VIERKHYNLASRHNHVSFHYSHSTKLFRLFYFVAAMFTETINVDKIINAFTKNF